MTNQQVFLFECNEDRIDGYILARQKSMFSDPKMRDAKFSVYQLGGIRNQWLRCFGKLDLDVRMSLNLKEYALELSPIDPRPKLEIVK